MSIEFLFWLAGYTFTVTLAGFFEQGELELDSFSEKAMFCFLNTLFFVLAWFLWPCYLAQYLKKSVTDLQRHTKH